MPTGQPFTHLCQTLSRPHHAGRVDLHLHTTFSDGVYTPIEIADLARRSGLSAIAITDHDTLDGIGPTRLAAGAALEVISGVEITAEYRGKELHLLGYLFNPQNRALQASLDHLRIERVARFDEMVARLRRLGVDIDTDKIAGLKATAALGRRHVAELVVQAKKAASVREAFQRYLHDHGRAAVPKTRLPVADAIALVRSAGGVASWAHPNYDCTKDALVELKRLGLGAVEAEYPAFTAGRRKELRQLAAELDLAVTGGSDCHGPDEPHRAIAAASISADELMRLRELN